MKLSLLFLLLSITCYGQNKITVTLPKVQGAQGIAGPTGAVGVTGSVGPTGTDNNIAAYRALGSTILYESVGLDVTRIATTAALVDQALFFTPIYIPTTTTITGVMWYQTAQGSYTANNYNGVALYSYSGGTLTLIDTSVNDGTIWKIASNTYGTKNFNTTHSLATGIYYIGVLYCRLAVVTAPSLGFASTPVNAAINTLNFTNSAKLNGSAASQTTIPTSKAMSTISSGAVTMWIGVF